MITFFLIFISLFFINKKVLLIIIKWRLFIICLINLNRFRIKVNFLFYWDLMVFFLFFLTIWISLISLIIMTKLKNNTRLKLTVIVLNILLLLTFSFNRILLFYFTFETSIIPIYLIIIGWGYQPERIRASYYLLFYTLFGSLPLLVIILYLYFSKNTICWQIKRRLYSTFLILFLILAFLIKTPIFLLHSWLPKAHVEAPTIGSIILAAIILKLGRYGLIRIASIIYNYSKTFQFILIGFCLFRGIYRRLLCLIQNDIKILIAYSSVVHISLLLASFFIFNSIRLTGIILLIVGHGLCSSGLFLLTGIIYESSNSRSLIINKRQLVIIPFITIFWFLLISRNMSAPPSLNLFAELILIVALYNWNQIFIRVLLFIYFIFSIIYSLFLFSRLQYRNITIVKNFGTPKIFDYFTRILHWSTLNIIFLLKYIN